LIERLNQPFVRIDASLQKERRFTADAAHELRTPVAAIKAQAQVARAASNEVERIHALDNAILGCDRAAHLIDQLLTLARIDTLDNETTEPCQLELAEGDEVTVHGNPALLRILLRNLIDNAVKHTPAGTSVRVDVANDAGQVYLSVSDNGPGIPQAELERVSERFYRPLGTQASGSGLGLSIVKRIAEIHDASLRLAPRKEGSGLNVTVTFKS
jgi:two-component system sensor histidine kinase QseC